jgi:hypothetical protein
LLDELLEEKTLRVFSKRLRTESFVSNDLKFVVTKTQYVPSVLVEVTTIRARIDFEKILQLGWSLSYIS